jgi:AraC family carnitine catabolism transcriptional activator
MASEVANAMVHSRRSPNTQQRLDQPIDSQAGSLVSRLTRTMEQNLDFPLSLEELAQALDTPKRTLARTTETAFGISPMRLYQRIRLQAARNFLFYEDLSIKEIATACGFSAPATFSRTFKIQFGVSPSNFRAEVRERQRLTEHPEIHRIIGRSTKPERSSSKGNSPDGQ